MNEKDRAQLERIAGTVPAWKKLIGITENLLDEVHEEMESGAIPPTDFDTLATVIDISETVAKANEAIDTIEKVMDEEHIVIKE